MTDEPLNAEALATWKTSGVLADRIEAVLRDQETAAGILALARVVGSAAASAGDADFDRFAAVFLNSARGMFDQCLAFQAAGIPRFPNSGPATASDEGPRVAVNPYEGLKDEEKEEVFAAADAIGRAANGHPGGAVILGLATILGQAAAQGATQEEAEETIADAAQFAMVMVFASKATAGKVVQ